MAKGKLQITSLHEEYNKLRYKVNPLLNKDFRYGGASGKRNTFLKQQIRTMKSLLKGYEKFHDVVDFHNYLYKQSLVIALRKSEVDEDTINRIKYMSNQDFHDFYDWLEDNYLTSEVLDFNDYYKTNDEDKFEKAVETLNAHLDTFYEKIKKK